MKSPPIKKTLVYGVDNFWDRKKFAEYFYPGNFYPRTILKILMTELVLEPKFKHMEL